MDYTVYVCALYGSGCISNFRLFSHLYITQTTQHIHHDGVAFLSSYLYVALFSFISFLSRASQDEEAVVTQLLYALSI